MNKPKLLRAPAALLRYFRATSVVVSAIIFSLLAPTPLIDAIHRSVFKDEKGRPPHPLRSVYLAYLLMRACNIKSENTLTDKISRNSASKRLGFRKQNIDCSDYSPHSAALNAVPLKIDNILLIPRKTSICNLKWSMANLRI